MDILQHPEFWLYVVIGFIAQLIDGTLGMAYGITASSLLLGLGISPIAVSATVHAAECVTTGASALSHHAFGNINKDIFKKLLVPGVLGAIFGAYILSDLPAERIKLFVSWYLLMMGILVLTKAFKPTLPEPIASRLSILGFTGAFLDAIGGGGWGPIVASNLIQKGHEVRFTVGSVNAVEFFVTLASSVTFFLTLGISNWHIILGLAVGGLCAAPIGGWACKKIPRKPMMIIVGLLIIITSAINLFKK